MQKMTMMQEARELQYRRSIKELLHAQSKGEKLKGMELGRVEAYERNQRKKKRRKK